MTAAMTAKKTKLAPVAAPAAVSIEGVKGFDRDLKCRGFQFEIGQTYEHDGPVKACDSGFHAVEYPLDALAYYPPSGSRYALVRQSGAIGRHSDDTKIASARITIGVELHLSELIERAVRWVFDRAKPEPEDGGFGQQPFDIAIEKPHDLALFLLL